MAKVVANRPMRTARRRKSFSSSPLVGSMTPSMGSGEADGPHRRQAGGERLPADAFVVGGEHLAATRAAGDRRAGGGQAEGVDVCVEPLWQALAAALEGTADDSGPVERRSVAAGPARGADHDGLAGDSDGPAVGGMKAV